MTNDPDGPLTEEEKAAWLAALRSGTIPQIYNRLRADGAGPGRCAIGVLSDILRENRDYVPWVYTVLGRRLFSRCVSWNDLDQLPFSTIADLLQVELMRKKESV